MIPIWLQTIIIFSAGIGLGILCFVVGAWVMFKGQRQQGGSDGFLVSPKGDVFRIDEDMDGQPPAEEPTLEEKSVIEKTNRFLSVLGRTG